MASTGVEQANDMPTEQTPLTASKKRLTVTSILTGAVPSVEVSDTGSFHAMDQDDPSSIVVFEEPHGRTTIFNPTFEKNIQQVDSNMHSWLSSISGMGLQFMIIFVFIGISVYESIFKKKALKAGSFDFTSIIVFQGAFSVILSVGIAACSGTLGDMFNRATLVKLLQYFPVGCTFSMTAYLQFVILEFLAVDVFKILEQGRLLVTAIISLIVFQKNQSHSGWCALVVITFAAISYGQISQLEKTVSFLESGGSGSSKASKNFALGFMLTLVFICLQCGASVYSELILKKDKHMPFYIQKFYLEVPGTLFGLFLAWKVDDFLIEKGWQKKKTVNFLVDGPFAGWDNHWVILCFIFFVMKSWGSGFLVKQMSSLVKQLCSVTSVGLLYFFALVHLSCSNVNTFFCPGNFMTNISPSMVMADCCVLFAVTSYTLAQRDKTRKMMYRDQAEKEKMKSELTDGAHEKV